MSPLRQIKTLVTLDVILIMFVAWIAMTNFLFKNVVDYKLFFLSLVLVFLMQCISIKKNNKYISIILPIIVSIPFMWILFDGLAILINLTFVIISVFVNLTMEELPVDYEEYKSKAKQGAIIISITAIMSFWLEKSTADYLYRFFINYMIITVILFRESRNYYYKVIKDTNKIEKTKKVGVIKNLFINVFFKYGIVIVSTIMLTTDWVLKKSLSVINVLNKGIDVVIRNILDLIIKIVGPIVEFIVAILNKLFMKAGMSLRLGDFTKALNYDKKENVLASSRGTAVDNIIWKTTLKIIILVIIILFIVDVVKKMKFMKIRNEQSKEEKEKIHKNGKGRLDYKHNISSILKKIFRMNYTIKDKILNVYREFEKTTKKADLYKSSMTATQLKNTTKKNIENHNYLDEMTDIYNEVKFSNCEPKENQLDIVKKAFENVKKQL